MNKVLEALAAAGVVALVAAGLAAYIGADPITVAGAGFLLTFLGVMFGKRSTTRTWRPRTRRRR